MHTNRIEMKQLRSTGHHLTGLFQHHIPASAIAEPFLAFDETTTRESIRQCMEQHDFDLVGIRSGGRVIGFVHSNQLDGSVDERMMRFDETKMLDESASLSQAIAIFADHYASEKKDCYVFIRFLGEVTAIITKGDLQKIPVRIWLMGLLSLLEMQFLRIIRLWFVGNRWKNLNIVSRKNLGQANKIFDGRKRKGQSIDLLECLYWIDKANIVAHIPNMAEYLGYNKEVAEQKFLEFNHLRNDIFHGFDYLSNHWSKLFPLIKEITGILQNLENINQKEDLNSSLA